MNPRADAEAIFRGAVARVDPAAMIDRTLRLEAGRLVVATELEASFYELSDYDRIVVVGMGKASGRMAAGIEAILGEKIAEGLVAVKEGQVEKLSRIRFIEAGHPVPDERSVRAASEILELASRVREAEASGQRCLVIILISGGGSALLCAPMEGLSLAEKAEATRLLLGSGASIQEMNTVRKHLSAVKGGRLARAFAPATILSLVLSDVVGDDLDAIASGPAVPDTTSWAEALAVVGRRGVEAAFPAAALALLRRGAAGELPDTPKPGDPAFEKTRTVLLGSNRLALLAAEEEAIKRGYRSLVLSSRITGEAREAALVFLGIGKDIAASGFPLERPACLIAGGETTVTLRGKGKGGRNQEMALAFLAALGRAPKEGEAIFFLSAGTDGNDGPTDAAGAFASLELFEKARALGLDPDAYLAANDSHGFFDRLGALLRTGPTGTNVCDVQLLIVV